MDRRNVRKIFIQRDYTWGTAVRFSTDFPRELTGKVSTRSGGSSCVRFRLRVGC